MSLPSNVTELFEVREALEVQAARLAARRRDRSTFIALRQEFDDIDALLADRHRYYDLVARLDAAVDDAAANPYLVSTLDGVRTHVARIRRLAQDDPARLRNAAREHAQILDAIVDGDESLAASATQLHLHNSLRNILKTQAARTTNDQIRTTQVKLHPVRVYSSSEELPRENQLAWKIAEVASEKIAATDAVVDMVINRIIDNASVATASLRRGPIVVRALAGRGASGLAWRDRVDRFRHERTDEPGVGGLGQRGRRS